MKRVLFVDDEPKILQGLRRMLRSEHKNWEMIFAEGPEEAKTAAALLDGQTLGAVDAEAVCDALAEDIEPLADLTTSAEAKAHLMKVLTREALASLAGGRAE